MLSASWIILVGTILMVGLFGIFIFKDKKRISKDWLSFGGAFLVSVVFLYLFPLIFGTFSPNAKYWVLGGFFMQLVLEQFTQGIEHGHVHSHERSVLFFVQIILGLCIHSFAEGLALGGYEVLEPKGHDHSNEHVGSTMLLVGILLHHIPAVLALVLVLMSSGFSKKWLYWGVLLFSFAPYLGMITGTLIHIEQMVLEGILAGVAGSFLHVSTTILFETDDNHHLNWKGMIAPLIGVILALISLGL